MQIHIPAGEDFPAFGEIIFEISDVATTQNVDVDIVHGTTVLGTKRLRGDTHYEFNVAPYYRSLFNITPDAVGVIRLPDCRIMAGGNYTPFRTYTVGIKRLRTDGKLTDMPQVQQAVAEVENPVELRWLNPYSVIDKYVFSRIDGERIVARKSRAKGVAGHEVYLAAVERQQTLQSDNEDAEMLRWLAQLISSPYVWVREQDGTFTRVDVVTDAVTLSQSAPKRLTITIRDANETLHRS